MPLFWRYLAREYLKVFFLSILAFVAILLVTRLKEIATFITLASNLFSIIAFTLYQIPHILPIAISISCLISSILLFQKLSKMHELTALRACGLSLKTILAPLLFLAMFLSLLNFFIASELTPRCRAKSKELVFEKTSMNPIVLLQRKQKLPNIKRSYIEIDAYNKDKSAKDIIIITPNKSNNRLSLLCANNLEMQEDELVGKKVTLISYMDSNNQNNFDNLLIENQDVMSTKASVLSDMIKSKQFNVPIGSLPLRLLLIKSKLSNKALQNKIGLEIVRRIAFALSAFSFTFVGASFGIQISRTRSKQSILVMTIFSFIILFSFTLGKALKNYPVISIMVYILPQIIVLFFTALRLKKISRGYE